ncbi:hypothetical protein EMCG_00141 [[Emmonsia] crescens]|uniref:Uncharacterized protein n=1 Tax=[Emmonsia] crescens TaxID=73230 RepID=A0A0G2IZI3_9EURO|nr:hypothetical protein EMCG_00141 [Emmonsia crescens UAMH 3008]
MTSPRSPPKPPEPPDNTPNDVSRDARHPQNTQARTGLSSRSTSSRERYVEDETIQDQATLPATESLPTSGDYKLSVLLGRDDKSPFAELASILEHCNKISEILDPVLCTFEKAHPVQDTALRQALGHGIARAILGHPGSSTPTRSCSGQNIRHCCCSS